MDLSLRADSCSFQIGVNNVTALDQEVSMCPSFPQYSVARPSAATQEGPIVNISPSVPFVCNPSNSYSDNLHQLHLSNHQHQQLLLYVERLNSLSQNTSQTNSCICTTAFIYRNHQTRRMSGNPLLSLQGKVILIVGAGSLIGNGPSIFSASLPIASSISRQCCSVPTFRDLELDRT